MTLAELLRLCEEAATELVSGAGRPVPPTVVLPTPRATRLVRIPELPDDDDGRLATIAGLARDEMRPLDLPAYGFLAEAELDESGDEVLLLVYGAHRRGAHVTAAPFADERTLGDFEQPEPLDAHALPFLRPLQQAADAAAGPPGPAGAEGSGGIPVPN